MRRRDAFLEVVRSQRFLDLVEEKLAMKILERAFPMMVAVELLRKYGERKPKPVRVNVVKHVRYYRMKFRSRMRELRDEVLSKIEGAKAAWSKADYNFRKGRISKKFDVEKWLFSRQKWAGTLTADGKLLTARPLKEAGDRILDDLDIAMSFDIKDKRVLAWIATNAKNAGWSISDTIYEDLREKLMEAVAEGMSIPKIRDMVSEVFGNISRNRAELIARTEVLKASNRGIMEGMIQSRVVESKEWMTTEDDRTCEECMLMDGKEMGLEEPFFEQGEEHQFESGKTMSFDYEDIDHPPLHPDCRCTIIAILKEE